MLVLCRDTGVKQEREISYKAPDGKYYTSEDAYKKIMDDKQYWHKSIALLGNILGYSEGQKFPTVLPKKLSELRKGYTNQMIYETILRSQKSIEYALHNKCFKTEYAACAYVAAIIVNSINDVKKEFDAVEKAKKVQPNVVIDYEEAIVNCKQRTTNISRFLED